MSNPRIIRSRAPLRVSFGGGGTDVRNYFEQFGGVVLSSTISQSTYCTIVERNDAVVRAHSKDLNVSADFRVGTQHAYDGQLDLVKAVLNHFEVTRGADVFIHSDAPPGSGLGSSSSLIVTLVAAFAEWQGMRLTPAEVARLAVRLERDELGIPGGVQDQYAAAFGGFNWMEFEKDGEVLVTPIRLRDEALEELEYRSILAYVGKARPSANVLHEQVQGVSQAKTSVVEAHHEVKRLANRMRRALVQGDWNSWGPLLNEAWEAKKQYSSKVTDPHIDAMYEAAIRAGATGGKLLGAGAGGYLYVTCQHDAKHDVANALRDAGAVPMAFHHDARGVRAWNVGQALEPVIPVIHRP